MIKEAILYAGLDALHTVFPEDKPLADKTPKKKNNKSNAEMRAKQFKMKISSLAEGANTDDKEDWSPFGW